MESNLIDIVKYIISQINLEIPVASVAANIITVCSNTLHVTVGKIITAPNGDEYKVTAIDVNSTITVEPSGATVDPFPVDASYFTANPIEFLYGDPKMADNEYLTLKSSRTLEKTPFIWVLEPYDYDPPTRESSIEASFNARIFFMEWANSPEWISEQHNDLAIKPMQNLAAAFMQVIEEDFLFKTPVAPSARVKSNFGVVVTDQGSDSKIIDEDLSGVTLRPQIDVYDLAGCKC